MSLLRARESVARQFRQALRRHALNEPQWRVLRVLAEMPEVTASVLARETAILSPSLSRMLVAMERRGLIRREPGRLDQRQTLLSMAPAGRELFERAAPDFEQVYEELARAFGQARLDRLHAELEALRQALVSEPRSPGPRRNNP
ncbi:MAG: homoprotocatechuate degradation operon regulator HpaR [Pseudomonadota bacterium]